MTMDPLEDTKKGFEGVTEVKRCPKCGNLSLEFDKESMSIRCQSCGFKQYLKK